MKLKSIALLALWISTLVGFSFAGLLEFAGAQEVEADPAKKPRLSVGSGGMQRHVPGRWAMLAVSGRNPTDSDIEGEVSVVVGTESNLQFSRRVWVPAGARRQSALPIQIPANIESEQHQIDIAWMELTRTSGGTEQFEVNAVGSPQTVQSLLLSEEESRAAVMLDRPDSEDIAANEELADISTTLNVGRDLAIESTRDSGLFYLHGDFWPSSPVGLDAVDQIIIASDRVLQDTLSIARLRSWIQSGGKLWLMVDQVSHDTAQTLLGDLCCYSEVDRVELNEFEMVTVDRHTSFQAQQSESWSEEIPVELVRVVAEADDVFCSIDGWPTAFRKRLGSGEVLFTTLGARGWLKDAQPMLVYQSLSRDVFGRRPIESTSTAELISFVDDEIGYEIPGRKVVATLFGLHLLVVVAAGVWLARNKNLQYLAAVVPIASLLTAVAFFALGNRKANAIPSTVATSQIVRNLPHSSETKIHTVAAVYSQDSQPLGIVSSSNSTSMLRDGLSDGEVKRIQWDDSGQSKWLFVKQPPGVVRHVEIDSTQELSEPWVVRGTFTDQGFTGTVFGVRADRCEDAVVVATPAPSLAVELDPNSEGSFSSSADDVLAADQFIRSTMVSNVQRDRQQLIRDLLANEIPPFGNQPIMLVWTDPVYSGVEFDDGFKRSGSALVSLPIELQSQPSGSKFQVPASFMQIRPFAGARGSTAIFNWRTAQWIEMSKPSEAELRCDLPRVLLPCELTRANVTIKLSAPSRTLQVKAFIDGEFVTVFEKRDPSGLLRFSIDDAKALQLDDQGGLILSLAISASEDELLEAEAAANSTEASTSRVVNPSRSTWKVDYFHVDVEGITQ